MKNTQIDEPTGPHIMRTKFKVESILSSEYEEVITMQPLVTRDNPHSVHVSFRESPDIFILSVRNPKFMGIFRPGAHLYVDFTEVLPYNGVINIDDKPF